MTRLLLVRHGETQWNKEERFIGISDVPLNEEGRRQAEALSERLAGESIDIIYSSEMKRSVETAQIIAQVHGMRVVVEPRLREVSYGDWEGLTAGEVEERTGVRFPSRFDAPQVPFPSNSSVTTGMLDVRNFLDDILASPEDRTILLVGHGVSFQMILYAVLDIPSRNHWLLYMHNASISEVFIRGGKAVLVRLNDTSHL